MIYPENELAQLVIEACAAYGIEHVVISPGSRNAPLTLGFTNHSKFKTYSIVDERCAGFFALGIAQQIQKPTAVVCTSGSALLNYYPAVAEAFYSNIPMIVISADRPRDLIDIGDGQTIRQENVFLNHSLFNANLLEGPQTELKNKQTLITALQTAIVKSGPVHINVPFDEPLYGTTSKLTIGEIDFEGSDQTKRENLDFSELAKIWNGANRKLVLVGTHFPDTTLQEQLAQLSKDGSVLVLTETTSNLHHHSFINSIDKLIFTLDDKGFKALQPEVLITIGGMVVSKKIKQILRKHRPKYHWHVDPYKKLDTYHCLSHYVGLSGSEFLKSFLTLVKPLNSHYQKHWLELRTIRNQKHQLFLNEAHYSDLKVFAIILKQIPNHYQVQFANSSIIRYAQLFNMNASLPVFCNRGTSGIDGCTSTAIGAALIENNPTLLVTGDIGFFYDSNALWNNYIKKDFKIVLINNSGGGIFRIIEGPGTSNALNYFETQHQLTAKGLCETYNIDYDSAKGEEELKVKLKQLFDNDTGPGLLEIFTPNKTNDQVLKSYFRNL